MDTVGTETAVTSQSRPESPDRCGMFQKKRWIANEQQTLKQMRKFGVSDAALDSSLRTNGNTSRLVNSQCPDLSTLDV